MPLAANNVLNRLLLIPKLVRYGAYRLKASRDPRLIMTILVKNELDIIEANIRTHAHLGVDGFAVMDNGSTDGTRELLDSLGREYEIQVIEQGEQTYQQRHWMTWLAFYARDRMGADWVISNDADEFWIPEAGSLRQDLGPGGSVITCHRYNMVLTEESLAPGYRFFDSCYRVHHPILYGGEAQKTEEDVVIPLSKISDKVIVNPHGLVRIAAGNHRAIHAASRWSEEYSRRIHVYHYPIRSFEQFRKNIENRKQLLLKNRHVTMGMHYSRWVRMLDEGKLEREYDRFILRSHEISVLERIGVIRRDHHPRSTISSVMGDARQERA